MLARSCNKAERERYFVFGESFPSRFSRFEIDVTGCRYAEFYKELGEPELGFLLVCGADFTTAEGFGPDIKLTRTQTIMQGASHCDFRYKRSKETD